MVRVTRDKDGVKIYSDGSCTSCFLQKGFANDLIGAVNDLACLKKGFCITPSGPWHSQKEGHLHDLRTRTTSAHWLRVRHTYAELWKKSFRPWAETVHSASAENSIACLIQVEDIRASPFTFERAKPRLQFFGAVQSNNGSETPILAFHTLEITVELQPVAVIWRLAFARPRIFPRTCRSSATTKST